MIETKSDNRPRVLLLGPSLAAVSGVSSHLCMLRDSALKEDFGFCHFQIGSEGRNESRGARLARLIRDPFRLWRRLRQGDVAVLHVNSSLNRRAYWRDLAFVAVARLTRTPLLFQVHGGALPRHFFRGNRLLTAFLRLSLSLPQRIVVLGNDEAAHWRAFLPRQSVVTIPNAIDCAPYRELSRSGSFERDRLHAVYLGRLAAGKGLCELLHGLAMPTLSGLRPRLTIAGDGPERRYLQQLARDLGLLDVVEFTGPVFGNDKLQLLARADVFILPSYSEGLPYALLEAMAAGTVPVTTPVGAIPDVVDHGVHGYYVPPRDSQAIADALQAMHRQRDAVRRMSDACRERALQQFGLGRLERDFMATYRQLSHATGPQRWAEACHKPNGI